MVIRGEWQRVGFGGGGGGSSVSVGQHGDEWFGFLFRASLSMILGQHQSPVLPPRRQASKGRMNEEDHIYIYILSGASFRHSLTFQKNSFEFKVENSKKILRTRSSYRSQVSEGDNPSRLVPKDEAMSLGERRGLAGLLSTSKVCFLEKHRFQS
jgi:hypothetical protein